MKRLIAKIVLSFVVACAFAGGAAGNPVEASKTTEDPVQPKRIFVISRIGTDWGDDFAKGFQRGMTTITKACGTDSHTHFLAKSDTEMPRAQIKAFQPDTILLLKLTGGFNSARNYDVTLIDFQTNKIVWQTSLGFSGDSLNPFVSLFYSKPERGALFAMNITNEMKEARLFGTCPIYDTIKDIPAATPSHPPASVSTNAAASQNSTNSASGGTNVIDLPANWVQAPVSDTLKAKHVIYRATNKGAGAMLLISERKPGEVPDIQKYAENLRESQMNVVAEGSRSEIDVLEINNMPARRFTVQGVGKLTGQNLTFLITVIEFKEKFSALTVEALTDHFPDNREAFIQLGDVIR